jgi:hypothetical protein
MTLIAGIAYLLAPLVVAIVAGTLTALALG